MLIIIGSIIVMASTLGGFMIAGGNPAVLLHVSEFVVILGVALGVLIIASPGHIMKEILHKVLSAMKSGGPSRADYEDMLKLLYEIFMVGRRNGLIALEEHVMSPAESSIFQRYPNFTGDPERMQFLINGLKPIIDGKIKPDQLEELMFGELEARGEEKDHPVHLLQLVGDSLPGIGIVAAVLGIINTMSIVGSASPAEIGHQVAAHPEVLLDSHAGEHRLVLQNVGDAGLAQLLVRRKLRDVGLGGAVPDLDVAGENPVEAEDRVQHGRLAGAVRPDQAQRLAAADTQIDAVQDLHLAIAGDEIVDRQVGLAAHQRVEL